MGCRDLEERERERRVERERERHVERERERKKEREKRRRSEEEPPRVCLLVFFLSSLFILMFCY